MTTRWFEFDELILLSKESSLHTSNAVMSLVLYENIRKQYQSKLYHQCPMEWFRDPCHSIKLFCSLMFQSIDEQRSTIGLSICSIGTSFDKLTEQVIWIYSMMSNTIFIQTNTTEQYLHQKI